MADCRLQLTRLGCGTEYINGYHQDRYQYDGEVQIQFLILERRPEAPHRDYVVEAEVDAKEQHEDRRHILGKRCIFGQPAVENRKTACPGGAECDTDRIKQRHFADEKEQNIQKSQDYVQRIEDHRRITHARDHLGNGRSRRFGAQQMHHITVVFPGRRHDGKEEHQHTHASDPVAERAPVQKTFSQRLHVRNHRSTCCREAADSFKKSIKKSAFKKKFLGFKKCYSINENVNKLNSQNNNDEGLNFIKGIRGLNMLFYTIGMVFIIILHSPSKLDCPQVIREIFINPFYSIIFYSIKYAPIFLLACSGASLSYKFLNYLDEKIKQEDFDANDQRLNSIENLGLLSNDKKTENYGSVHIGLLIRFISYQFGKYIIFILTVLFTRYSLYYFTSFFKHENPTWDYFKFFLTENITLWKLISNFLLFPSFNFFHENDQYNDPTFNIIFDYFWLVFNEMILFLIGIIIIYICIKKDYQIMNFTYVISALCIIFKLFCHIIKINRLDENEHYAPYILTYSYYGKIIINPLSNVGTYFIGICFGIYLYTFQKEITAKKAENQGKEFLHKISFNLLYILKGKKKTIYYYVSYILLLLVSMHCIGQFFLNFDIAHKQNNINAADIIRSDEEKEKLFTISKIFNYFFIIENEIIVFLTLKSIFYLEIIMNSEFLSFLKIDFWRIINKIYFSYIIIVIPMILFFVYHSNTKILFNFTNIIFYSFIICFLSFVAALFYYVIYEMPLKNLIRSFFRKRDKNNIRKNLEDIKNNDNRNMSILSNNDSIKF